MLDGVKVLMLDAPQSMLDERHRLGLDGRDEMWDGVLHMVPPPSGPHQRLSGDFYAALYARARALGLVPHFETGLFHVTDDFRIPDQLYCRPEHLSERGAEGAELVVEVRSPRDETYDKIPFYTSCAVREMLVIHPGEHRAELLRAVDGELRPVEDAHSQVLDVTFTATGDALRIAWEGGFAEI